MTAVVVTCHGDTQAANLRRLDAGTFAAADLIVVVLSSTTPCDFPFPNVPLVPDHGVKGFNAGANRDAGLAAVQAIHPDADVLFLDGDCIPGPNWLEAHKQAMATGVPTVTCGARTEDGRPDPRTRPLHWDGEDFPPSFYAGRDTVQDYRGIEAHRATWSCNLGINRAALLRIQAAGELVHDGQPRIFAPEFDGTWGGEDTGLGLLAHLSGCRVVALDPVTSYVEHQKHATTHTGRRNLDNVGAYGKRAAALIQFHLGVPSSDIFQESTLNQEPSVPEATPISPELPTHLFPEDLSKVTAAGAASQEASTRLQEARAAVARANEAMIGANAVLVYVSKEVRAKYSMAPQDSVELDGKIVRGTRA